MGRALPRSLLIALAVLATLTAASATVGANGAVAAPRDVTLPVRLAPGFAPTRLSSSLKLTITVEGCGPRYERTRLRWSARRLTITLLARPYMDTHVACPAFIALVPIDVPLHRALGDRAIYDGSADPPRLVTPAPAR